MFKAGKVNVKTFVEKVKKAISFFQLCVGIHSKRHAKSVVLRKTLSVDVWKTMFWTKITFFSWGKPEHEVIVGSAPFRVF